MSSDEGVSGGVGRRDVDVAAMGRWMARGTVAAFALALVGAVVPGPVGAVCAVGCLVVLIGAPVVRVLWLTVGWAHHGDRRFAALGLVMLGVLAVSGLTALF